MMAQTFQKSGGVLRVAWAGNLKDTPSLDLERPFEPLALQGLIFLDV